jgi:hypothetical protein
LSKRYTAQGKHHHKAEKNHQYFFPSSQLLQLLFWFSEKLSTGNTRFSKSIFNYYLQLYKVSKEAFTISLIFRLVKVAPLLILFVNVLLEAVSMVANNFQPQIVGY